LPPLPPENYFHFPQDIFSIYSPYFASLAEYPESAS